MYRKCNLLKKVVKDYWLAYTYMTPTWNSPIDGDDDE